MPTSPRWLAGLLLSGVAMAAQAQQAPGYRIPPALNDNWRVTGAETLGLDPQRLASLTAMLRAAPQSNVHALLIERGGRLVYEEYFDGSDERWGRPLGHVVMTRDTLHDLRSVSKSVVSALVGIALAEGAISSVDRPVLEWFPEFSELDTPERRRITLAHALGMTAGLGWDEGMTYTDPRNDEIRMTRDPRPLHYVLSRPLVAEPGERFNYNGGLTQVLAAVLQRSTGVPVSEYARRKLFAPLGISDVEWLGNLDGLPAAASGLRLRARDLAKIGSLYLHGGRWNGIAVLPAEWVEQSTRRHFVFTPPPGAVPRSDAGYAWQWWYSCLYTPAGPIEARIAVGNGMQRLIVLPGLDLVVTLFAGRYNDYADSMALASRILREQVIPAVTGGVTTGCPGASQLVPVRDRTTAPKS